MNTDPINKLITRATELNVYDIAASVIHDSRFSVWSGSSKPIQHHYGKGGLAQHTSEVVDLCFQSIETLKLDLDPIEVYLSALYHDCGKMWDYKPLDSEYKEWAGTEHKRQIHHISRSALTWNTASTEYFDGKYNLYTDRVLHNILSHHGLREWGSPVAPYTKAAWLLHLCDGISARMNDADTLDVVKI